MQFLVSKDISVPHLPVLFTFGPHPSFEMKVCVVLICVFLTVYCTNLKPFETVNLVNKPRFYLESNDGDCACNLFDELYQDDWMRWLPSTVENVNNDINEISANETAPGAATDTGCPSGQVKAGSMCVDTQ